MFCLEYVSLVGAKSSPVKMPLRTCWGEGEQGVEQKGSEAPLAERKPAQQRDGGSGVASAGLVTGGADPRF